MRTFFLEVVIVGVGLCLAEPVHAQDPLPDDPRTRNAARQLAQDGADLMREGRWEEAHKKLHQAHRLVPAPTILVLDGDTLVKMGRLVEAAEHYEEARRFPLTPSSPEAFRQAIPEALDKSLALQKRIPQMEIHVVEAVEGAAVVVDGRRLTAEQLDAGYPIDPGAHDVALVADGETLDRRRVVLQVGERRRVELGAAPPGAAESPTQAPEAATVTSGTVRSVPLDEPSRSGGNAQRTIGWVSLGVGGAGLLTGLVAGAVMLDEKSTLDDECTPRCPPSAQKNLDGFRTARTISTVGWGVGLVGAGVGAALVLTAPSEPQRESATVMPYVGVGNAGLVGRF